MKISDICPKTLDEINQMPRFDMNALPKKPRWYLQPVAWLLSFPELITCHTKIYKHNMDGLKGGYLLLCNHNSFLDFKVATKAIFPRGANYIVAIDGFINREKIMRNVGCICKRKFISDIGLVKHIKYAVSNNNTICAIYPEARYSLVGTTAIIPDSLGKMVKLFKAPVVTLICHGDHLRAPVWNLNKRKIMTTADMTYLLTPEDIKKMSIEEINAKITEAFQYDDYQWQLDNKVVIDYKNRAKNLHKMLYKCPFCGSEHDMHSDGNRLWCDHCHKEYEMDTLGRLKALEGRTEFEHIPDWYEWERSVVRKEVEDGTYKTDIEVDIDSLPNSTGFYRLGRGKVVHDSTGFHLTADLPDGTKFAIEKKVIENYSVHVEYDYFGKGDGFSFSTLNDTYYMFPVDKRFNVTKVHFAVEELYKVEVGK